MRSNFRKARTAAPHLLAFTCDDGKAGEATIELAEEAAKRASCSPIQACATLIENCKLSGINPHTWLAKAHQARHRSPRNAVGELMPWTAEG